jgi:hypothetical protein
MSKITAAIQSRRNKRRARRIAAIKADIESIQRKLDALGARRSPLPPPNPADLAAGGQ